ncbi:MAG: glycosyl hydrolase, partial [Armatimonadota bacterium]|nr:glycosyl hydrolase [Armatimonadota bacterium]
VTDEAHEGSNVFALGGFYWMITDPWYAFGVYRSDDLVHWAKTGNILGGAGTRPQDGVKGALGDVVTLGDHAFIFYFTHPGRIADHTPDENDLNLRRSVIQVARLEIENGGLKCLRDEPFDFFLPPMD